MRTSTTVSRISRAATEPVDGASAAVFRIAFGVAMVVNTLLYLPVLVRQYYIDTTVHFAYGPLTFVRPLPALGMYLVYVGMGATGALIALGKWYRPAAATFFVLTTYVFLIDSTYFQNHEYLISLLSLLLIFLPLDRRWSLRSRADRRGDQTAQCRHSATYRSCGPLSEHLPNARRRPAAATTIPRWVVWLLRFQIGVPYFYGGIAKLNADWLRGEPLRQWLGARTDVEPVSTLLDNGTVVWGMTYGALLLDLAVVWLLLHRRTRVPAFVVVTCFHLMNAWLFGLFIFPWLMIAATTIFFPPDWPHRWRPLLGLSPSEPAPVTTASPSRSGDRRAGGLGLRRRLAVGACGLWVLVQVLVPLRHYAIDGNPSWTEQGHRFAWHMMLRGKHGSVTFIVTQGDQTWLVDPRDELGDKQAARLPGHPERLVHFARHLSDRYGGAEVRAETSVSLNGRAPQPIVDPTVDLAAVALPWRGASWILPLEEPLP